MVLSAKELSLIVTSESLSGISDLLPRGSGVVEESNSRRPHRNPWSQVMRAASLLLRTAPDHSPLLCDDAAMTYCQKLFRILRHFWHRASGSPPLCGTCVWSIHICTHRTGHYWMSGIKMFNQRRILSSKTSTCWGKPTSPACLVSN